MTPANELERPEDRVDSTADSPREDAGEVPAAAAPNARRSESGLPPEGVADESETLAEGDVAEASGPASEGPPPPAGRAEGRSLSTFLALLLILVGAAAVRFAGLDWDQGQHLHPDERFLTMVESALAIPDDLGQYFDSQESPLNPRNRGHGFFVYGTWPITLVHLAAVAGNQIDLSDVSAPEVPLQPAEGDATAASTDDLGPAERATRAIQDWRGRARASIVELVDEFGTDYSRVYLVGRRLMVVFDLLSIVVLFLVGRMLYDRRVGLLAAALAAATAFLIQQAHFFTVDTAVTFFVLLFILAAAGMQRRGGWGYIIFAGVALGMALASKISVWPLAPIGVLVLLLSEDRRDVSLSEGWGRLAARIAVLGLVSFATLRVAQPDMWAGPGWPEVVADPGAFAQATSTAPSWWFTVYEHMPESLQPLLLPEPRWAENMQKVRDLTTGHGTDWPPNHQWWGRVAYWFPFKNMVLWGMGLLLGLAAWTAWLAAGVQLFRGRLRHLLPVSWVGFLFLYQGAQWTKTMRYFLPIYPMLILLAAWGLIALYDFSRSEKHGGSRFRRLVSPPLAIAVVAAVLGGTILWGFMFSRIYARDHSRIAGSDWLYHNTPAAMTLTVKDGQGPGLYMPVNHSSELKFEGHSFLVQSDERLNGARVLVPTEDPVTIDGVQLAYVTDPAGDLAPEAFRAWLTTNPFPDETGALQGVLAEGETTVHLSANTPRHVRIGLPDVELTPGGEYYVWVEIQGAPVRGRPAILGYETRWDDAIPMGMYGYAAYDDPSTSYGEGFFGQVTLDLYAEDTPIKVEKLATDLAEADYVVITSNRVYGSIAQLPTRFPMTLEYYRLLFSEELGYEHVADIHSFPSLGSWEINDQSADEAWHVYDHPKVDIFARTPEYDSEAVRARLMHLATPQYVTWTTFNEEAQRDAGPVRKALRAIASIWPFGDEEPHQDRPLEDVMLSPERQSAQEAAGTWSETFDIDSSVNRSPILAVLVWYLVLALVGLAAFPLVSTATPNLADKGWAVSRAAGLLLASWLAWMAASLGVAGHGPRLVLLGLLAVAAISLVLLATRRREMAHWFTNHWRVIAVEELAFAAVFLLFVAIRMGNPDLWHPYFGGEKPMDFAYLNAILRTESFPPYDPWFAGGKMNYYYFGFVVVGALVQLSRVVPWVAYNLIIPSLAAMTGLGVFSVVYHFSRRLLRPVAAAVGAGFLGLVLAVISGNLYQIQLVGRKLAELSSLNVPTEVPGLETLVRAIAGWYATVRSDAHLSIGTGNWYWDASRAITVPSDTPITEFPFFTFLYADLHAHMMALPITVLALALAVSWAFPTVEERRRHAPVRGWQLIRIGLAALAIGSLWPTNTWDYPTYGLVVAGAIGLSQWERHGRLSLAWLRGVLWRGIPLLVLSLLLFAPYHLTYVRPYGAFQTWTGTKTPLASYLTIHGIFLFAIVSLAIFRLGKGFERDGTTLPIIKLLVASWAGAVALMGVLWWISMSKIADPERAPGIWLPAVAAALLALGLAWLGWPRLKSRERFAAWIFVLGVLLTQFVEYAVLAGDIGRMNTVFKFYIQVWILWSTLAAISVVWLLPRLRRSGWGAWWQVAFVALVLTGLLYPATATRAKIRDRFPAMGAMPGEVRSSYEENWGPGLSGIEYQEYAVYDDDGEMLKLNYDREAIEWLLQNVEGTPTILEGFREKGYRWGARYSIHTGLPTVIGWDWHQKQQKNAVGHWVVDERTADVREAYETGDIGTALEILGDYSVDYVIVGQMERAFYESAGLAKFDQMVDQGIAERVYENPGVTIYRIVEGEEGS